MPVGPSGHLIAPVAFRDPPLQVGRHLRYSLVCKLAIFQYLVGDVVHQFLARAFPERNGHDSTDLVPLQLTSE